MFMGRRGFPVLDEAINPTGNELIFDRLQTLG